MRNLDPNVFATHVSLSPGGPKLTCRCCVKKKGQVSVMRKLQHDAAVYAHRVQLINYDAMSHMVQQKLQCTDSQTRKETH